MRSGGAPRALGAARNNASARTAAVSSALPLVLAIAFVATAVVGLWAAHDRTAAWFSVKLLVIGVTAAASVTFLGRYMGEVGLALAALGCTLPAGTLGAHMLLTHDWIASGPETFVWLHRVGVWIQAHRPHGSFPKPIHPNITAAGLALVLPLGVGGLVWARSQRRRLVALVSGILLLVAAFALVLSASRGAWLGLGAATVTAFYLEWRRRAPRAWRRHAGDAVLITSAALLSAAFLLVITRPGALLWLAPLPGGGTVLSRSALWRDALLLIRDYPFTGSGLHATKMVHASFARLLHVPFVAHTHNLFLELAVEQGLPGLAAFSALLGLAARRVWLSYRCPNHETTFRVATTIALLTLIGHGMLDAGVYWGPTLLVLFLPIGFALALTAPAVSGPRLMRSPLAIVVFALGGFLILLLPAMRAALLANLGAVAQTRAELAVYQWPEWPMQDAVRRAAAVDLAPAIARYEGALALDADNVTANWRLGQILLSRGDYERARHYLRAAHAAAPAHRPTAQLLAECDAIAGDTDKAAALWQSLDVSRDQLQLRRWWYALIGERQHAALIAEAIEKAPPD